MRARKAAAADQDGMSRVLFRLRPTLLSVLLGLLMATVAAIGSIAYVKTAESIETLARQQFSAVVDATLAHVQGLVAGVPRALREYELLAQRGVLPIDDDEALGMVFVERLRQNPQLAWIGFADARDDSFVAASRRNGAGITLYTARPEENGGVPIEVTVEPSGRRARVANGIATPYRAADKAWFKTLLAAQGLRWLDPYVFNEGRRGVTAGLPLLLPGAADPVGVLHVDLYVDGMVGYLDGLAIGRTGHAHLLSRNGGVVASPTARQRGNAALVSAIAAIGDGLDDVRTRDHETLEVSHDGEIWRASFAPLGLADGPDWIVAVLAPEAEFTGLAVRNAWWTLAAGLAALAIAAAVAMVVSSRIAVPLHRIAEDLKLVAAFSFDDRPVPASFVREVAVVGQTVGRMKASLRSFSRYVPVSLVHEVLASGRDAQLGGERRRLTIHFSDIAGFTSIAEGMPPERLVEELGDYFALMRAVLRDRHGTIDKYMGDGILAFFNAPLSVEAHEIQACHAALEAQAQLAADRAARAPAGRPQFSARIGLGVGEVIVGNIGTPDRFAYTVIGDAVNLASRLEGLNKFYGTAIIGSGELKAATGDAFEWRRLDRVAVVGRTAGTDVYQLLGRAGEPAPDAIASRDRYEAALVAYFAGRFAQAAQQFREQARAEPDNQPAQIMARRARKLARRPPEGEWTGVYVHAQK